MDESKLRERQSPEARVYAYIKDPLFGGNTRKFVRLVGLRSVQTSMSMTTSGSATVTFPNYKSALMRYVSMDNIIHSEIDGQGKETTNTMGWNKFMSKLTDTGPNNAYFASLWNDITMARGEDPFAKYFGRSRGDIINTRGGGTLKYVNDNSLIYAIPFLNLFDPIFVDFKGQDGKWYAKFTGLITRVSENYARTGDQSITISCKDLSVLLDNVSLISGWNMLSVAEANSNLRQFIYSSEGNIAAGQKAGFSDIFSSFKTVEEIILKVVSCSQDMWRFESGQNKAAGEVGVRAFKFDTDQAYDYQGISGQRGSIQMIDENMEKMLPEHFYDNEQNSDMSYYLYDEANKKIPGAPELGYDLGLSSKMGRKKILIDPLIREFDNKFIQKLLNRDFALFRDSLKSADQILNEISAKMFCYKYFDGNGNLVFELAKPNALPSLTKYGGRSSSTFLRHAVSSKTEENAGKSLNKKGYNHYKVQSGDRISVIAKQSGLDYNQFIKLNNNGSLTSPEKNNPSVFGRTKNNVLYVKAGVEVIVGEESIDRNSAAYDIINNTVQPIRAVGIDEKAQFENDDQRIAYLKYTTLRFHGKNYILSPDDFISFASAIDESALTTEVATTSNFAYYDGMSDALRKATYSLYGIAVADFDFLAKLGVRRFQTQALYNVSWPDADAGSRVLSYQSAAILERVNCMADSGSFAVNQRPELQLGRTFINPLRMKAYIITGITDSWTPGAPHTTNLTATYGHSIHKTLEVPWLAIFMEPEVFFKDGAKANIFEKVTKVDEDGNVSVNDNGVEPVLVAATGGNPTSK